MVDTRSGAGVDVPSIIVIQAMEEAQPEQQAPPQEEVPEAEGFLPQPEEAEQLTVRHTTNLERIKEIIDQHGVATPVIEDEDRTRDILRLARAAYSGEALQVQHMRALESQIEDISKRLGALGGALHLSLHELRELLGQEVQRSVATKVEHVLREHLVDAVQTMPHYHQQLLNSALGSRGNGNRSSTVILLGKTTPFPWKVRTDWACKLRPGIPPREPKTYLDDVREYLTLPQHVEYRNEMQFIRTVTARPQRPLGVSWRV